MKPAHTVRLLAAAALAAATSCTPPDAAPPTAPTAPGTAATAATAPPASPATTPATDCGPQHSCTTCGYPGLSTLFPYQTDPLLGVTAPDGTYGTNPSAPHCYAAPSVASNGLLLVFLAGSSAVPTQYQMILYQARALGYYVLSLSWPNGATDATGSLAHDLTLICKDQVSNPDCWGEVLSNRFTGAPEGQQTWTDPYKVTPDGLNSVQHRLTSALKKLGWTQFLSSDQSTPKWASIVMAGHSQGGSEATLIGSQQTVKGVATFSSADNAKAPLVEADCAHPPLIGTTTATWVTTPFVSHTPLTRYIGLIGCSDLVFTQVASVWKNIAGPSGGPAGYDPGAQIGHGVIVDTAAPPYALPGGTPSHQLGTNALPSSYLDVHLASHDATVLDCQSPSAGTPAACSVYATPVCAGQSSNPDGSPNPALKPAWQQMLITAGGFAGSAAPSCAGDAKLAH